MSDRKFAVLTDSACDLPFELAKQSKVDIMNFEITLDGQGYTERVDFDFDQYYTMLRESQGFPSTAHVTMPRFITCFEKYDDEGVEDLLYICINSTGSATRDAAVLAQTSFYKNRPDSKMKIHIVDSHTYSMAYGWYVVQAAQKLEQGQPMDEVVRWLEYIFSRMEIVLAAYSLKFMKRSGRISAAAAFAGELLGVKPIVSLVDGESVVRKKVRADKDVLPALLEYADAHCQKPVEYAVGGTNQENIDALAAMCEERWNTKPTITFKLGAAVSTNTGPDAIAITYLGAPRQR